MNLTPDEADALNDWITARAQYIAAGLIYETTPANSEHDFELSELKADAQVRAAQARAQFVHITATGYDPRAIPFKDLAVRATFRLMDNVGQVRDSYPLLVKVPYQVNGSQRLNCWVVPNPSDSRDISAWCLVVPAGLPSPTHPDGYGLDGNG